MGGAYKGVGAEERAIEEQEARSKGQEDKEAISRAVKLGELSHSCETCQLSCEVQTEFNYPNTPPQAKDQPSRQTS